MKRFILLVLVCTALISVPVYAQDGAVTVVIPNGEIVNIVCQDLTSQIVFQNGELTCEPVVLPTVTPSPTATLIPPTATATLVPPTATPVPTATLVPTATNTQVPTATPTTEAPVSQDGIWISQREINELPMSGEGWNEVLAAADATSIGSPSLYNQDSNHNVHTMAQALVCARTGIQSYCNRVLTTLRTIATGNLESGTDGLPLGRELGAYVISADIINLKNRDAALDGQFRTKIKSLLTYPLSKGPDTLIECDEERPNNWGGHCGFSRIAVDLYLGDRVDLEKAANVFKGWLGDRSAYSGFLYNQPDWEDWQADPNNPVGVNPVGSEIQGHDVSGAQPEEMRRAGSSFVWPPKFTDYGWEGLQGRVASAKMLYRAGYVDVWDWSDRALLRAVQFLYDRGWPAVGDDQWQPWIINKFYGTDFPTTGGGRGKNVGWTRWTDQ